MAVAASPSAVFELKSAALTLVAVALKTADPEQLERAFEARFADAPGLFDNDPVAIDLTALRDGGASIAFGSIVALLRKYRMQPVAVRGGNAAQMEAALAAGLVEAHAPVALPARGRETATNHLSGARSEPPDDPPGRDPEKGAAPDALAAAPGVTRPTQIIDKPLRSGQLVYAKGADLVVLAVVSFGAEIIADGNIHVYAPLRGRALAGARGDTAARIFTTCLEPQLVSIAGLYRTAETDLPPEVLGRPAQVRLDGEKLVVEPLKLD